MLTKPIIEPIPFLSNQLVSIETLRLDKIHPIVSGNKWYKLRFYLQAALESKATTIASFGGPYSNHLVAMAYAAKKENLKSIGYVRTNENEPITPSLAEATELGMQIIYLGRSNFQEKKNEILKHGNNNGKEIYFINEGGYGALGASGASTILTDMTLTTHLMQTYDYIVCAVGTGTMIAGIVNAKYAHQKIIGIPVLKNEGSLKKEIITLLKNKNEVFELLFQFHQGGYAKTNPLLFDFMNRLWKHAQIPTDLVYTGKLFFAIETLVKENYFAPNSKVLVIHSGGLQGNRSLASGILNF